MTSEFDLIRRHFTRPARSAVLGVGDDCALLRPRHGNELAVSTDMLLEGRHFLAGTNPQRLGHKALAVNLSDLAAMGADARWALLSIALPSAEEAWTAAFAKGFFDLADRFSVDLVGGDTTSGPLAMSVTVLGEVPTGFALRRDGAKVGDDVWLSGSTGDAALGLACLQGQCALAPEFLSACQLRLEAPEPRLELGGRLRGIAHSAIDVSDGLLADLGHILEASDVAAELEFDALPRSPALASCKEPARVQDCLLSGGDDYELVFTAPSRARAELRELSRELGLPLTRIGTVLSGEPNVLVRLRDGSVLPVARHGFDHFAP